MVAAESGAKHTIHRLELGADEQSAHREAVGNAFSHSDYVGANARILVGKEAARAAIARLNLIENEHGAVSVTLLAKLLQEVVGRNLHTAYTLNALNNHRSHIVVGKLAAHGLNVAKRHEGDNVVVVDGRHNLAVVGSLHSKRSTAMECLAECHHAATPGVECSELQSILISLGTRVDEKELIIVVARNAAEQ